MTPRCRLGYLLFALWALGCAETPVPNRVSPTEPERKHLVDPIHKKGETDPTTEKHALPQKEKMPDMPVIPKGDIG